MYRVLLSLLMTILLLICGILLACGGAEPVEEDEVAPPSKIAFVSDRDGNAEIYVMDADGSNPTNLTNNPAVDGFPVWSPDGRKIAFVSDLDGNAEIYVMDADGSNQTNLTNNPAYDGPGELLGALALMWSPDSSKIAFISWRDDYNAEIYVMDADGSNQTNLSNSRGWDYSPAWSPDGSKIAFVSPLSYVSPLTGNNGVETHVSYSEVYVMDTDGSNPTNLTNYPADDSWPAWAP